ncbi:hypothetical protein [Marinobacter sp. S0848L]|uniref:hypothetical protein n=1 Tax=Marinobacter sp. S0848L TaxID=2926423 RepID=UPI001FF65F6F|nr:hypothetical protein [Marinobacter sp. S0848L]MCK0107636.1 hypothetical protein [Marinobacter sp. S0848L]
MTAGAGLNLDYLVEDRRIEFADVRLAGAPGVSMGGLFLDHSVDGYFRLRSGGAVGGEGYTFDTAYTMTGGRLGYRTNGSAVFLDDVTMNFEALGVTLDMVGNTLQVAAPRVTGDWSAGAIRYSDDPAFHGRSHGSLWKPVKLGALWMLEMSGSGLLIMARVSAVCGWRALRKGARW